MVDLITEENLVSLPFNERIEKIKFAFTKGEREDLELAARVMEEHKIREATFFATVRSITKELRQIYQQNENKLA